MANAVGEANLSETQYFFPAADDMALFQQEVPGIYVFLGVNADGVRTGEAPFNHSPEFFVNEEVFISGVKFLSTLAADYLQLQGGGN
jgi:amidohydrolase